MEQITAEQFYSILEASARYFTDQNSRPKVEEESQTMEQWWYEFKQYMEDDQ